MRAEFDGQIISYSKRMYHNWILAPDPAMTLAEAEERADIGHQCRTAPNRKRRSSRRSFEWRN